LEIYIERVTQTGKVYITFNKDMQIIPKEMISELFIFNFDIASEELTET